MSYVIKFDTGQYYLWCDRAIGLSWTDNQRWAKRFETRKKAADALQATPIWVEASVLKLKPKNGVVIRVSEGCYVCTVGGKLTFDNYSLIGSKQSAAVFPSFKTAKDFGHSLGNWRNLSYEEVL